MVKQIIKRDGRHVAFQPAKVAEAILLAVNAAGGEGFERVAELTDAVMTDLEQQQAADTLSIETVEETVEYILFRHKLCKAARAYVLHRFKKEQIREEKDELMAIVREILVETKRENANVGNSPAAKMLQIAATASRLYYVNNLIPREFVLAHQWGEIHIHDLDYYGKTLNCLQIDLSKLLRDGFNPGYGFIRPAQRVSSAASLAASIIQSNQNDMYGGQSFPHFDRSMAAVMQRQKPLATEAETFQAMESFVFTLNTLHSRAGGNVPFSCINIGTDISPEGRLVTRAVLETFGRGLGRGETALFPNIVFRLKKGVNFDPTDPNYDLFQLALRTAARRMNPTFSFMDASFNRSYGDEVAYMGCRSRVIGNRNGAEVSAGRGNIAPVTINLPRIALKTRRAPEFFSELDRVLALCEKQLLHRYHVLSRIKVRDLPFLMMQQLYLGSETLQPDDDIGPAIQHGTLAIGFIGLAETLVALTGRHHGADDAAWKLGFEIVSRLREATDRFAERHRLNFTAYATPAEGVSGRFPALDRQDYGLVEGVTDKEYYTNSFHVPVAHAISAFDKIDREAPFHRLCSAGHITYVELEAPPVHNTAALEKILRHMGAADIGYAGINFPLDECPACGFGGEIKGACPQCGHDQVRRIRRITGYLSTVDRFSKAKQAELSQRVKHSLCA